MSAFSPAERATEPGRDRRIPEINLPPAKGSLVRPRLSCRRRHWQPHRHFGTFLFYRHHCLRKMRRQRRRTLRSITRNGGTTENILHLSRRTLSPVSLTDGGQDRRRRRTPARNLRQLPDYERSYSLPDIPSAGKWPKSKRSVTTSIPRLSNNRNRLPCPD